MTEKISLTELSGVGEATAKKWAKLGYDSLEKIANASSQELVQKLGINITKAQKLIAEARSILIDQQILLETAGKILEFQESIIQRIPTGSKALDRILGGGIQTDASLLLGGAYSTGKTQLCLQACVNCVVDLGRKAVFIETEPSTFKIKRLIQMFVLGRGYIPLDMTPETLAKYLTFTPEEQPDIEKAKRYISEARGFVNLGLKTEKADVWGIRHIQTPEKLYRAYELIENKLLKQGIDVGLICIDSFIAPFRATFQGRGRLSERNEELARHIGKLETLSSKYNLAVIMTAQVYGIPDDSGQMVARRRFGIEQKIYGGEYLLHSATYQLSLNHVQGGTKTEDICEAYLFDSPDMPKASARFVICKEGIRDVA